ncbi:transmembrane s 14c isoform B [Micractinium conductrix]|uniref:Transmembrane s 14c isoform A n=1 Tax=Micractinium conductrix TaxID=554055 RepID=A0A2P6V118_9CHLO|nr:transmembrane s 14c isoform A [Micractinium conductrix]PSC67791.1 transmembrane s 14c isoform B [Micractinium conductrix]|eukprot:PSC67790.1 transmembrane s 14c isoform A [Micractinium conductrix]
MERPTGSNHLAFTMAAITAAGGVQGWRASGSRPSLVAGLGNAALFGLGGAQISSGRPDIGHPLSLVASLALVGAMAPRFAKTKKLWPAGVMSVTGALSAACQGVETRELLSIQKRQPVG